MRVIVEQLVEWRLPGETEVLGENLPQRHFVHHKSHMTRPGLEPGPPRWDASAWAMARPYLGICLEGMARSTKNLSWPRLKRFKHYWMNQLARYDINIKVWAYWVALCYEN
jgi:hypothetical protein